MSILVSERCANELKGYKSSSQVRLSELIHLLEGLQEKNIDEMPNVHLLKGEKEPIYVLKHRDLRVFFTKQEGDVVLLSVTDRKG